MKEGGGGMATTHKLLHYLVILDHLVDCIRLGFSAFQGSKAPCG
jgi:hypothetical protein